MLRQFLKAIGEGTIENEWYFDRELLEAVRKWEESETTGAKVRQISLSEDSVQKAQEEQALKLDEFEEIKRDKH